MQIQIDSRTRQIVINGRRVTLGDLQDAASQPDPPLAAAYAEILRATRRALSALDERERRERIRACPGHRAEREETTCFGGPVAGAEENRAAHGGVTCTEYCRCGARRAANLNGRHVEQGKW